MNLSEISIRNHVFAWMLMAAFLIFGGIAFDRMGVSQLPDVDFPVVSISVNLEGAAPEIIEADVVDTIEGALTSVQGVKGISSSSKTGSASISVEFGLDKDIDVAVQDVQSAISRVQGKLPTGVDPPSVRKSNPELQPIIWLGVTANSMSRQELMALVRDQIQDRFATIQGVGEVRMWGFTYPNLRVWLSQEKLNRYQLTATDVISTIQREHSELPGGRIETREKEYNIRTLGEAPSAKDFGNITINRRGGSPNFRPIPLREVAKVEEGTEDIRSLSRTEGNPAVGIGITKQPGANAVQVAHEIKQRLKEVSDQLPKGVEIGVRFDTTQFIEDSISELNFTLVMAAILTALVCWLFLGSWSATINVILAIPTSVVGSFIVLYALGFTLNTFTLLGLSLAIGIVVDDAIMVLENIVRHLEQKKSKFHAALDGSKEITLAAMAATVAIIAIFLPVAFMDGVIGKYFFQFGVTLSVAVAISLLEALTITPMRCSRFLTISERTSVIGKLIESLFEKGASHYKRIIPVILRNRKKTLFFSMIFFIFTFLLGSFLKQEFVPAQDQGRLILRVQTPVGSSFQHTDEKMKELEAIVAKRPEVETSFSSVGGGSRVNGGSIFLNLKPASKRKLTAQQLMVELRKELKQVKGTKVVIQDPSLSGFAARRGFPVEFTIRGPEWEKLVEYSNQITAEMEKTGLMTDIDTNYEEGMPEIQVRPDRVKARERGVDISEISQTVNVMMASAIAGKYTQAGRRYDVRVGLPPEDRNTPEMIKHLTLRNNRGELLALSEVVTLTQKPTLQSISREDRQRAINVYANVAKHASQTDAIKSVQEIGHRLLPTGYYVAISGSSKTFQSSFKGLIFALLLGIIVSYMILASQFNSFIHPITILMALPFSLSGAFVALLLTGQSLNIYSMIGLILLMGIVKKNSILLVEFTNQIRKLKSISANEALIEACPVRLRPILMTSIATISGAIPAALAVGPGAESRVPMAIAVIGGVLISTLLTLFIVPCVYSLIDRKA
ncbi:MAG: efflux RND transporter permease subunit [Bacteriovoracia bacterium]